MDDDDRTLVERCRSGDESALRAFVQKFQGLVFGLCYRMLGQREDAEDTAQEVFLRAFRHLHQWDPSRPLKPWLTTIAVNRCRTARRRVARRPAPVDYLADAVAAPAAGQADLAEELQLAVDQLRDDYRACFIMFYQQEMSCLEIAESLECPEGTVKTWLYRARQQLAEHLQRRRVVSEVGYELHGI